ncbi:MAG TPA: urea ABC transporter ATP-binding subunit UrtE [Polyangia bacterium]|jgi:urea transport system ATP-binding protein|nr:urea ABC transporter ATP-binding subunit UrtE [Polyangia bacterium]
MLDVDKLSVGYGQGMVIRDLALAVKDGESVVVLGRNGMGKTTLLKALIGLLPARGGSIRLGGADLTRRPSYARVAAGMAYVPQGRLIFPYLTVEENILAGMDQRPVKVVPDFVYECFPVLAEMRRRRGGNLSGGQQQQLAIARALVAEPKLLLLDEPTEGIQPSINKEIARTLTRLKVERGFALLVSEQALSFARAIADRIVVLEQGEIVYQSAAAALDLERVHAYLTLATRRPAAPTTRMAPRTEGATHDPR